MQDLNLLRDSDRWSQLKFDYYFQNYRDGYSDLLSMIGFTEECMFRLNGRVKTQSVQIREQRGFLKAIKKLCTVQGLWDGAESLRKKVIGPYTVEGGTVTADSYKFLLSRKGFPAVRRLYQNTI